MTKLEGSEEIPAEQLEQPRPALQTAVQQALPNATNLGIGATPAANDASPNPVVNRESAEFRAQAMALITDTAKEVTTGEELVEEKNIVGINRQIELHLHGKSTSPKRERYTVENFSSRSNDANYTAALPLMKQALELGETRWYKEYMVALMDRGNIKEMLSSIILVLTQGLTDGKDEVQFLKHNKKITAVQRVVEERLKTENTPILHYLNALLLNSFKSPQKFGPAIPAIQTVVSAYNPAEETTFRPPMMPTCEILSRGKIPKLGGQSGQNKGIIEEFCLKIVTDPQRSKSEKRAAHLFLVGIYEGRRDYGKGAIHRQILAGEEKTSEGKTFGNLIFAQRLSTGRLETSVDELAEAMMERVSQKKAGRFLN